MVKRTNSEKGFSLIEIIISIGVLAIIMVAIAGYFRWSFGVFGTTDRRATAESLARSQMEAVKEEPYNAAGTYTRIAFAAPYNIDLPTAVDLGNGLQKITVVVTYPSFNDAGVNKSLTLEGYKLNR